MPAAARITDMHACPKVDPGPKPHVGGPVVRGEPSVIIGNQPAARVGDKCVCVGPPDSISKGESSVLIGNKPAARLGDSTSHGGKVTAGCPTVLIGSSAQGETLRAKKPVCEECEKQKKKREIRKKGGGSS
jgi:uncharacterized Zn-binding protein involved in type VI secretion